MEIVIVLAIIIYYDEYWHPICCFTFIQKKFLSVLKWPLFLLFCNSLRIKILNNLAVNVTSIEEIVEGIVSQVDNYSTNFQMFGPSCLKCRGTVCLSWIVISDRYFLILVLMVFNIVLRDLSGDYLLSVNSNKYPLFYLDLNICLVSNFISPLYMW